MNYRILASLVLMAVICFSAITAVAAGFDCAKASNRAERMICKNDELSTLDDQLTAAYRKTMASSDDKSALKESQRAWLAERNQITDVTAMAQMYRDRINLLQENNTPRSNTSAQTVKQSSSDSVKDTSNQAKSNDLATSKDTTNPQTTDATSSGTTDFMKKLALVLFICALVVGLFFGLTDRAIFYNNSGDFFFCFIPVAGFAAIHLIFSFLLSIKDDRVNYLAIAFATLLLMYVIYRSCVLNNMNYFVGITVGIAKVTLGLFAFIQLYRILSPGGRDEYERRKDQIGGAILFALCSLLISTLVNGERVAAIRAGNIAGNRLAAD